MSGPPTEVGASPAVEEFDPGVYGDPIDDIVVATTTTGARVAPGDRAVAGDAASRERRLWKPTEDHRSMTYPLETRAWSMDSQQSITGDTERGDRR